MKSLEEIKSIVNENKSVNKIASLSFTQLGSTSLIIRTTGEYSLEVSALLSRVLQNVFELGFTHLIIDLTKVGYVSSTGVGFMLEVSKHIKETGGKLAIFGMVDKVYSIFHLLGFTQFLNILPSEEAAIAYLRK
jgi:anti-anti-sigma factor